MEHETLNKNIINSISSHLNDCEKLLKEFISDIELKDITIQFKQDSEKAKQYQKKYTEMLSSLISIIEASDADVARLALQIDRADKERLSSDTALLFTMLEGYETWRSTCNFLLEYANTLEDNKFDINAITATTRKLIKNTEITKGGFSI